MIEQPDLLRVMHGMDLFCGASGSGVPTQRVLSDVFDARICMRMLNHNPVACASARANHPDDPARRLSKCP